MLSKRILGATSYFVSLRYCHSSIQGNNARKLIKQTILNYKDIKLQPFRVRSYVLGDSFSEAHLDIQPCLLDQKGKIREPDTVTIGEFDRGDIGAPHIDFNILFKDAFIALQQYTDRQEIQNEALHLPLISFVNGFLRNKDYHAQCIERGLTKRFSKSDKLMESKISALLANHLFSRLSADFKGITYSVSNGPGTEYEICPCGLCDDEINYSNVGIGSEYLWYGYSDIMVYPLGGGGICNVVMPLDVENDSLYSYNEDMNEYLEKQLVEINMNSKALRRTKNVRQIVSQAITFSIYQKIFQLRKNVPVENLVSLIPTIATSVESFDVYLYDWRNDILLRNAGEPIPLFEYALKNGKQQKSFKLSSLIQLWMIINHFPVNPKLDENQLTWLQGSSEFLKTIPHERLEVIEETVSMQAKFNPLKMIDDREYKPYFPTVNDENKE